MPALPVLLDALLALAAAAAGSVPRTPSDAEVDRCVPTVADLEALLAADRPSLEAGLAAFLATIRDRWQRAKSAGLLPLLERSRPTHYQMAAHPVQWIGGRHGLQGVGVEKYYHRLWLGQFPTDLAQDLVQQAPDAAVASLTGDAASLRDGVLQLRRLDDLLLRVLAARAAADSAAGLTLAEVLALYRTEGNLGAPRAVAGLQSTIPPRAPGDVEPTKLRVPGGISPNIAPLVFLYDPALVPSDAAAREFALIAWAVQLAGLDHLAHWVLGEHKTFGAWSASNWMAHLQMSVSETDRQLVWNDLLADLTVETVGRDAAGVLEHAPGRTAPAGVSPAFLRVAPGDPERLTATLLAEAALFLRSLGRPDTLIGAAPPAGHSPPGWIMPPRLTYALYNLQVGGSDGSPWQGFIMSAVAHAWRTTGPRYRPLRDQITADAALAADIDAMTRDVRAAAVIEPALVATYWPTLQAWFGDATHGKMRIERVSDFIASADRRIWGSWDKAGLASFRGNANRYHLLYAYFHLLTGESPPF